MGVTTILFEDQGKSSSFNNFCGAQDPALKQFAGDNFVRKSGDYHGFEALQLHSLKAQGHGQNINVMVGFCRTAPPPPSWPPREEAFV